MEIRVWDGIEGDRERGEKVKGWSRYIFIFVLGDVLVLI